MADSPLIGVLVKAPNSDPVFQYIENKVRSYQQIVQGYIEAIPFPGMEDKCDMIVNDEGKLLHLQRNFYLPEYEDEILGTIIVVGVDTESMTWRSLTPQEAQEATQRLKDYI